MDCVPGESMIGIQATEIRVDGHPSVFHEFLLRVVGRLILLSHGTVIWTESEVPVIEFADHLARWLRRTVDSTDAFAYASMESASPELIWLRPTEHDWAIGSGAVTLAVDIPIAGLRNAGRDSVDQLRETLRKELRIDLDAIVS